MLTAMHGSRPRRMEPAENRIKAGLVLAELSKELNN